MRLGAHPTSACCLLCWGKPCPPSEADLGEGLRALLGLLTFQEAGAAPSGRLLPEGPSKKGPTYQGLPLGLDVLEQLIQDITWGGGRGGRC